MKIFLLFFLIAITSRAQEVATSTALINSDEEVVQADVEASGRFNYNIYYSSENPLTDFSTIVKPRFSLQTKPKYLQFSAILDGEYEKFFTQIVQDHFDYSLKTRTALNEGGARSFILNLNYEQFSDPSFTADTRRVVHQKASAEANFLAKRDDGNQIRIGAKYKYEDINTPSYDFNKGYLTHYDVQGFGQYDFKFLPETFWFLRATGGYREYVTPTLSAQSILDYVTAPNATSFKTNSYFGLGEIGINGRLTDKTSIDAATGFLARIYPFNDSFISPVFYLHFIEQVTRRDQLIAGYNYIVEDSYSTNYQLNQEIYLGLARMMGDQVLMLVRLSYEYKNYSTPIPRNDERITGGGILKYSYKPNLKFFAEVKVDLLATDYYDNLDSTNIDRPGSYKAGYLGLGAAATF